MTIEIMVLKNRQNAKLSDWLRSDYRSTPGYKMFDLIEINEHTSPSENVKSLLKLLIINALFDLNALDAATSFLGWDKVKEMIAKKIPTLQNLRRGDFGEIITNSVLEEFFGYSIPVQKLRYRLHANESLPGTDSIALRIEGSALSEVCFVESKTRSTRETSTAVEGYEQLMEDFADRFSDFTNFVLNCMYENKHPMFEAFLAYMRNRADTTDIESFRIGLIWERDKWSETCLRNLEEARESKIPRLVALLTRFPGVDALIDELYSAIGVTEISNDN